MGKPSLTVGLLLGSVAITIEATKTKQKPARQQGLLAPATSPNKISNRFGDVMGFLTQYSSYKEHLQRSVGAQSALPDKEDISLRWSEAAHSHRSFSPVQTQQIQKR